MTTRKLSAPWTVLEHEESFEVRSANGLELAFIYFEDSPTRRDLQKRLTRDEARRVAANIARMPELLKR